MGSFLASFPPAFTEQACGALQGLGGRQTARLQPAVRSAGDAALCCALPAAPSSSTELPGHGCALSTCVPQGLVGARGQPGGPGFKGYTGHRGARGVVGAPGKPGRQVRCGLCGDTGTGWKGGGGSGVPRGATGALPLIPELMLVPALCPNEPRVPWGHQAMPEPRGRAVPR